MQKVAVFFRQLFSWWGIAGLVLLSVTFRFWIAWRGYFPFTWDFGRDMLWVRKLTVDFEPVLVGAWGSLEGTFFGPLYFYLLAPPLLMFKGDPRAAVLMVTVFITMLIPLTFWWGKRIGLGHDAWWFALGVAVLPWFSYASLYSFPQHMIPVWSLIFLMSQWWFMTHKSAWAYLSLWFMAGLAWHFEPVNTVWAGFVALTLGVMHLWGKPLSGWLKLGSVALVGLVIPLIPNMAFDFRHEWVQVRAFLRLVSGGDKSYGDSVPSWLRVEDRARILFQLAADTVFLRSRVGLFLLWLWSLMTLKQWRKPLSLARLNTHNRLLLLLGFNFLAIYVYFLVFPKLLKDYYLYMVPVYAVLVAVLGWRAVREAWPRFRLLWLTIPLVIVAGMWVQDFGRGVYQNRALYYAAQKQIVDELYTRADGKPFRVYMYTPVVYDYPYQYLISWYGYNRYGYLPVEYTYLPKQPDYVYNKAVYDANKDTRLISGERVVTFLVREPSGEYQFYGPAEWLSNFPGADTIKPELLPYGFELRIWEGE